MERHEVDILKNLLVSAAWLDPNPVVPGPPGYQPAMDPLCLRDPVAGHHHVHLQIHVRSLGAFHASAAHCATAKCVLNFLFIAAIFSPANSSPGASSAIALKYWSCPPGRLQSSVQAIVSATF